jgi:CPA2 family monovalent cation:H+ antiporter-2
MGRTAFEALGYDSTEAQRLATEFEYIDRKSMVELASVYDINVPIGENKAYIEKVRSMLTEWEQQLRNPTHTASQEDTSTESTDRPTDLSKTN